MAYAETGKGRIPGAEQSDSMLRDEQRVRSMIRMEMLRSVLEAAGPLSKLGADMGSPVQGSGENILGHRKMLGSLSSLLHREQRETDGQAVDRVGRAVSCIAAHGPADMKPVLELALGQIGQGRDLPGAGTSIAEAAYMAVQHGRLIDGAELFACAARLFDIAGDRKAARVLREASSRIQ